MEYLMYLAVIFLISGMRNAITAQSCGLSSLNTTSVGGEDAPAENWPWLVSLHSFGYHICGGSLISHEWVLTAAHCVYFIPSSSYWTVYLGRQSQNTLDSNQNEVSRGVQSIIKHPDYDPSDFTNDIALMKLSEPVNFTSYISPICLAANDSVFHSGTACSSTGFGFEDYQLNPGTLQELKVKVMGNKECDCKFQDIPFWDITITQTMICAEGETGNGTCYGDSGGPLQCKQGSVWILAGVTNFGFPCGSGVAPDSFARVSEFQHWILKYVSGSDIGFLTFKSDGEDKDNSFQCYGEEMVSGIFYPCGNEDIQNLYPDNGISPKILLDKPFVYFGHVYEQTYINNNGSLTFDGPLSQPIPNHLLSQLNRDIIAPLWRNTVNGTTSYHQVTRGGILLTASNHIKQYFPNLNFAASWLFIVTWNIEPYFTDAQLNVSFQVVLVSGGPLSFVMMNYGNIHSTDQWFQAGYGTMNSTNYFSIPVADESELSNSSNVDVPGRWVFRVDGGPEEGIFYPYGDEDAKNPAEDFGSSPLIPLSQPFVYFGLIYDQIYVNNKGYLTFKEPFYQWYPNYFPAYSMDIIAPLWVDIDITRKGTVSYRQVTSGHILNRASRDINQYFPNQNFSASWVFIATWDKVPYYGYKRNESTFQIVLVSGNNETFTLMHYGNIDPPPYDAQSGYDTADSTDFISMAFFNVSDITKLSYTSNVNVRGRWVFRTDSQSESNGLFYPFRNKLQSTLRRMYLQTPFFYFGLKYRLINVYKNGFLTFKQQMFPPSLKNLPAYSMTDIVAPLSTNIKKSDFYFQEFSGVRVLQRVTNDIRQYFHHPTFNADSVFVCTWDNVVYYNASAQNSTFQVLLITGSGLSFIVFNYANIPQTIALAGYDTIDSVTYYKIPTSNIDNLDNSTNVNVMGRWAFRVDTLPTKSGVFYPIHHQGFQNPCQSTGGSSALLLQNPFLYFGRKYTNIYVNKNGFLTFDEPLYESPPMAFFANSTRDIIAPLWAELDRCANGSISYQMVTEGRILEWARNDIKQYFPLFGISVHTVFIATWNRNNPEGSLFQVVLVMCRTLSFVIMNYGNISSTDESFQAGFDTINSTNSFSIPVPDESKLSNSSNVDVPGRWVFRVDGGSHDGILYPFGDVEDEKNPPQDDGSSAPIPLLKPFVYFGRVYDTVFVNNNGDLTFDEPFYEYFPNYFPGQTTDIIAPLWTDIDNSWKGTISYRQETDGHVLERASRDINQYFPNLNFSASWVFIATWDEVPYYGYRKGKSTFQVVLVSGKNLSFALMHYDHITPTLAVEHGYDTTSSTHYFSIPVSDIANLPDTSNVNVMGRWAFRVDSGSKSVCNKTNPQDHLSSALMCGRALNTSNNSMAGGPNASAGHWPWQASLLLEDKHHCGGSIISRQWVLSAAHCFHVGFPFYYYTVVLGQQTQEDPELNVEYRYVKAVIKHPDYNYTTSDNDIALVKLSSPVDFNDFIRPVCLAADGSVFNSGTDSWINGWGNGGEEVNLTKVLQEVQVSVIGNRQCNCLYGVGLITDNMICAGLLEGGTDTCQGDSGGPMMSTQSSVWVQSGIVSFGIGCAHPKFPSVHTRVSRYQEWITSYTCSDPPGFVHFTSAEDDPDNSYICSGLPQYLPLVYNVSADLKYEVSSFATSLPQNSLLSYFLLILGLHFLFYM